MVRHLVLGNKYISNWKCKCGDESKERHNVSESELNVSGDLQCKGNNETVKQFEIRLSMVGLIIGGCDQQKVSNNFIPNSTLTSEPRK